MESKFRPQVANTMPLLRRARIFCVSLFPSLSAPCLQTALQMDICKGRASTSQLRTNLNVTRKYLTYMKVLAPNICYRRSRKLPIFAT